MKLEKRHFLNYSILIPYLLLSVLGLIVVYSTTSALAIQKGVSPFGMIRSQGIFFVLSLITILITYKVKLNVLKKKGFIGIFIIAETILL